MPRGGAREGSGRKRLGKTRVPAYLEPDTVSLFSAIARYEKISIGAAIDKITIDPDFRFLPAPDAPTENHYYVTLRGSRAIVKILKHNEILKILKHIQKGS
jgi:hypothetical protein